jgi:hypothetical protein
MVSFGNIQSEPCVLESDPPFYSRSSLLPTYLMVSRRMITARKHQAVTACNAGTLEVQQQAASSSSAWSSSLETRGPCGARMEELVLLLYLAVQRSRDGPLRASVAEARPSVPGKCHIRCAGADACVTAACWIPPYGRQQLTLVLACRSQTWVTLHAVRAGVASAVASVAAAMLGAVAVAGAVAGVARRTRRRSGCLAPSWAAWSPR